MATNQLDYCRSCVNKDFDIKSGILCKLTNQRPDFVNVCESYVKNEKAPQSYYKPSVKEVGIRATGGERFVNYLVDRIAILVLSFIVGIILGLNGITNISRLESYLITIILIVLYYTILESISGQTLGKLITGTVVITDKGETPDLGVVLGRSFSRLIPFEAFSFFGENSSGWHDTITETRVVKKSSLTVDSSEPELLDSNL